MSRSYLVLNRLMPRSANILSPIGDNHVNDTIVDIPSGDDFANGQICDKNNEFSVVGLFDHVGAHCFRHQLKYGMVSVALLCGMMAVLIWLIFIAVTDFISVADSFRQIDLRSSNQDIMTAVKQLFLSIKQLLAAFPKVHQQ